MATKPAERLIADDPVETLRLLPEEFRTQFLAEYSAAVEKSLRPEHFHELSALLRMSYLPAVAVNQPGYAENLAAVKAGTATFIPAEDVIPGWPRR